jgi:hypothetical protein
MPFLELLLIGKATLVSGGSRHLHENELADAGAGNELQGITRCVVDLQNLAIVDSGLHKSSSNMHKET